MQPCVERSLQRVVDEGRLVGDGHGEEDGAAEAGAAQPAKRHGPRRQSHFFADAQSVAEQHAAQIGHRPHRSVAVD